MTGLPDKKNPAVSPFLYIFLYVLICVLPDIFTGFQQTHNDFWDTYFVARHMALSDHRTWFNPQYPVANCVFLKIIMGKFPPEIPAILANILFGVAILIVSLQLYRKLMTKAMAFLAIVLLSLFPRFYHYVNIGGGDPASIALFSCGVLLILGQLLKSEKRKWPLVFIGGMFLGFAALFRYHVLVASVFLIICLLIVYRKNWELPLMAFIGLWCGYAPQLAVNVVTGHGLLETQFGMMNVYDLMYGLNWYQTGTIHFPPTLLALIGQAPLLFLSKYLGAFVQFAPDYVPALAALLIVKDPLKQKFCLTVALWTIAYCGFFSATTSGRALLLPLPLSFLCAGLCAETVFEELRKKMLVNAYHIMSIALVGTVLLGLFGKDVLFMNSRFHENRDRVAVENYLRGLGCDNVHQIFSTDFTMYFRSLPPYMPYSNGGAPRWGTYLFNEEYPEFPVSSLKDFTAECRKRGVRFILLTDRCGMLSPSLGALYNGTESDESIVFRKEIAKFKIFEKI